MSHTINKNDDHRWFLVQTNGSGVESIVIFGNLGEVGSNQLVTGQDVLLAYLTEDELEAEINEITGIENYYKDAVESDNEKFIMPSLKYESQNTIEEDPVPE